MKIWPAAKKIAFWGCWAAVFAVAINYVVVCVRDRSPTEASAEHSMGSWHDYALALSLMVNVYLIAARASRER